MVIKKRDTAHPLGGERIEDDDYAMHPTEMIVRGMKDGKPFRSLMPQSRLDEVIARCNERFAPGQPNAWPKLPWEA